MRKRLSHKLALGFHIAFARRTVEVLNPIQNVAKDGADLIVIAVAEYQHISIIGLQELRGNFPTRCGQDNDVFERSERVVWDRDGTSWAISKTQY